MLIPLTVTAAPTGDVAPEASLKIEFSDIKKSKINLFCPPTVVVPNPTISPKSPEYESTSTLNSITGLGGSICITGGLVLVYPVPAFVTVIPVIVPPALTVAVAVAVVNSLPSGGAENLRVGTPVYPKPILVKSTDDTVPVSEIIAVANPTLTVF